ncbi:sensor histidine kinase [Streptosporangium roseum]|uniref:histidine kinase n=1 Tax=Streptosporangium roseum (strain ATCC 12428 / DSM 43021 / JCM 3005 / KCTC 9067 / NCIMB 10171 / NRRL 2505 / NI 9100) TaxID=479432 RepID=D2BAS0_STRRD|nr:histidine kinase [Streptosporangium roseum]ACZ89900.1 Signal transduction histidine kinase-like protein [Streptosporangium roseum DSM 43021]
MTYGVSGSVERITPWALGAAVFLLSLASVSGSMGVESTLPAPVLAVAAAASGVAAARARRSPWPLTAVGAIAYAWLVMWPAAVVASYYAGTRLRRRDLWLYAGGAIAVLALGGLVSHRGEGYRALVAGTFANVVLMGGALLVLPLVVGLWVRARRQVLDALREQARQLLREQVLRAEQARGQERARIAREMHDVVAHRVSLMVLHAGALEVGAPDERTAEAAALIGGVGREALSNLREVLGVLRSPDPARGPQPTLADLDRLLDQSRDLGITVNRHDEGEARPLSPIMERTAYRVVQEALTNVHKHAGNAETDVSVRYRPAELEVTVRNSPRTEAAGDLPGSGWGLVGLRERVELVGGRLEAGPRDDGGFQVLARIPAA